MQNNHISSIRCTSLQTVALFVLLLIFCIPAHGSTSFLEPEQAFQLTWSQSVEQKNRIRLEWKIADNYYLYKERITIRGLPADREQPSYELPAGVLKNDPTFGNMEVFYHTVVVDVDTGDAREVELVWQGCAAEGLCYPPQTKTLQVQSASLPSVANTEQITRTSLFADLTASDSRVSKLIGEQSLLLSLGLFFLLGIGLAFTPCVLPMVPILSGVVVGVGASSKRAFVLSAAFVIPMALTYALTGAAAAMAGIHLQSFLQSSWTVIGISLIFLVLAAAMFGFFNLQLPTFLRDRLTGASQKQAGGSIAGAASLGFLSALLVGPCMTAPLAGILLYIAQSGDALYGTALLLSMGLGMGTPLLLAGTVGVRFLPKPGMWMERVKVGFGFLLLATGIWTVEKVIPEPAALALWALLLCGVGVALMPRIGASPCSENGRVLRLTLAVMTLVWSIVLLLSAAGGGKNVWQPLAPFTFVTLGQPVTSDARPSFIEVNNTAALNEALAKASVANKPALIDFSAEWCISCKRIEKEVFGDPVVQKALVDVSLIRVDITENTADQRKLLKSYSILGPPTVMLFDRNGNERREARLTGEFNSEDLLGRQPSLSNHP